MKFLTRSQTSPIVTTLVTVALALALTGCSSAVTESAPADLVLTGGEIYTVDAERSWAQAVAIADGKLAYVGSDDGAAAFIGADTRVVDLGGRTVLPSFQDCHIHPIQGGMQQLSVSLNSLNTVDDYVEAISAYAEANPDQSWILGGGWSMAAFGPGALARKELIDAVVADRPVYLMSADGHTGWVNSKALALAAVTSETPDPPSGRIDRDPATGDAIGSLQEGATSLVTAHIPPASLETRMAGLRYAVDMLNGYGITSIQAAISNRPELETYRALDQRDELSLRVVAALWWDRERGDEQIDTMLDLRQEFTEGRVRATTVKIMQDGVMENFTAALLEPYLGQGDTRGIPMVEPEALNRAVTRLDGEGFQVHFHAIGDAAVRHTLDAVQVARARNGNRGNRHHVFHLELVDPADIPRFAELDVVANFQPLRANADAYITELTVPYLGPDRSRWLYPLRSVETTGATLAFGSDWSVSTANPFWQIETAVTRMSADGGDDEPLLPEQRIGLASAVKAFTVNAAYVNGIDEETGSIETGKLADLIVLDRNLFEIDLSEISETQVLLTLMDGQPVHGDLADLAQ